MITNVHPALFLHSFSPSQLSDTLSTQALSGLSQRALLMANSNDIVCCDQQPDADYIAYLNDFGLATQHIIVPKTIPQQANSSLAQRLLADTNLLTSLQQQNHIHILEPYMATSTEWQVAHTLGATLNGASADYVAYLNQKINLNTVLAESELPYLPMQHCDANTLKTTALQAHQRYGQIVIRASLGLGSQNVWLANNEHDINRIHNTITASSYDQQRQYVISPFIANALSLNIQFLILPSTIELIGLSQQHIDASLHYHGNHKATIPATLEQQVLTQAQQLANYLQQQGYRGYIGFDLVVEQQSQNKQHKNKIFIIEINPRVNTSTFTLIGVKRIMGSLDKTCFASAGLAIPDHINTFQQFKQVLQAQNILLTPEQPIGILPLMSPMANRKIDIMLIAPTHNAIRQLLDKAQQQLFNQ